MGLITSPKTLSSRHVTAAAQNFAAAQFALHGFDVLEQAGRARYSYDLGVASCGGMMKIMVHGSLNGLWDLIDPYLAKTHPLKGDYCRAIALWLERYSHITCCLVHFDVSDLSVMPSIYLASAAEVAEIMYAHAEAWGEMALHADDEGSGEAPWEESLPRRWRFSQARITELMAAPEGKRPVNFRISDADRCRDCAEDYAAKCVKCLPIMN